MVSLDVELPTLEELDVDELKLSAVPLLAAGIHLAKYCDDQCKVIAVPQFITSRNLCFAGGKTMIPVPVSKKEKWCRSTQYPFDDCIKAYLGQDRPEPNYFNRVRLHKTDRPKPVIKPAPMPDRIPGLEVFPVDETKGDVEKRKVDEWFGW